MSKKVNAKKGTVSHSVKNVMIDGEKKDLAVKTNCKTFGSILMYDNGDLKGKCKTCTKRNSADVVQACSVKSNPEGFEVESKKRGSKRPFEYAISHWLCGDDKNELIEKLVSEKEMKETAAKRFANDIFSVGNAAVGKARKKGGLIETYIRWAVYGEGEEPVGCKATLGFCKPYAEAYKEFTI